MGTSTSWLAALGAALTAGACGLDPQEEGGARLRDGAPSDNPTVVALMNIYEVQQTSGTPLRVSRALGTGVLLCPNVVLTVQHVADFGVMSVTNREVALSTLSGMTTDRATGERKPVTIRLPIAEDAKQVGEPVRRTLAIVNDSRFGELRDGLALLHVEPPFPADLPYPTISTVTDWAAGEIGEVHGYGPSLVDESDTGRRRKSDLPFLGSLTRGPNPATTLLTFDDPHSVEGDSGGPILGPRERAGVLSLAGLDVGVFPGRPVSASFDLAANAEWIRTERDRLCAPAAPPSTGPAVVGWVDDPEPVAEAIELSGDFHAEVGPDDIVCLCDDFDCASCW